jgi:hypothetical protein
MDKDRIDAIAARGEQIKTNSTEFLWVCRSIKPPLLLPDKPILSEQCSPAGGAAVQAKGIPGDELIPCTFPRNNSSQENMGENGK